MAVWIALILILILISSGFTTTFELNPLETTSSGPTSAKLKVQDATLSATSGTLNFEFFPLDSNYPRFTASPTICSMTFKTGVTCVYTAPNKVALSWTGTSSIPLTQEYSIEMNNFMNWYTTEN